MDRIIQVIPEARERPIEVEPELFTPINQSISVALDLSDGDQVVLPEEKHLIKKVIIEKPETAISENIVENINIGGVVGSRHISVLQERTVPGSVTGDTVVTPENGYDAMTKVTVTPPVPVPENDVIFIDDVIQDIVYSYSAEEFLALTEMPQNPDHTDDGLISLGWNWTLKDAQDYVRKYGQHCIGQTYDTISGYDEMIVDIPHGSCKYAASRQSTSSPIDWGGDGTPIGMGYYIYDRPGIYRIKNASPFPLSGSDWACARIKTIIMSQTRTTSYRSYPTLERLILRPATEQGKIIGAMRGTSIKTLSIPEGFVFSGGDDNTIGNMSNIKYFSFPKGITTFYPCIGDWNLRHLCIPEEVNTLYSGAFRSCNSLEKIIFPKNITVIPSLCCFYAYGIQYFKTYGDITQINNQAFINTTQGSGSGLLNITFDFTSCISVPILSSASIFNLQTGSRILVPAHLEEEWKSATNWTAYASYIVGV